MIEKTLGDELIDEVFTKITAHKLNIVGQKIQAYYEAFQNLTSQEVKKKVKLHLIQLMKSGRLDYFYNLAMKG